MGQGSSALEGKGGTGKKRIVAYQAAGPTGEGGDPEKKREKEPATTPLNIVFAQRIQLSGHV